MKPVIALVGRPNVGKSTLFNRITKSRDAIVADFAGLTRDRHYGNARLGSREFIVIDTGGFEPDASSGIFMEMAKQTQQAVAESDAVIFVVDAREGLSAQDHDIAKYLRRLGKSCLLVANKAEGMREGTQLADLWLPVRINGDMAVFQGIMKEMLAEEERSPGKIFDHPFIHAHTDGYDALIAQLRAVSWADIEASSGLSRTQIRAAAEPRFRRDDEAGVHVHRRYARILHMGDQADAAGPEARVFARAFHLLGEVGREGAEHRGGVHADLFEQAATHHAHDAAAFAFAARAMPDIFFRRLRATTIRVRPGSSRGGRR
mgnify:CR=1 FL=1